MSASMNQVKTNSTAAHLLKNSSEGSVTMEYIIVSSFALLISISAVTWIGKVIKERVEKMASKVGADAGEFHVDWDNEE